MLFLLLFCMDVPVTLAQWKVSYTPENALLRTTGQTLLLHGQDVYLYDQQGNLETSFALAFVPQEAFTGPQDGVWIHDGIKILARLDDNHQLRWQKEVPLPTLAPMIAGDLLIYVTDMRIQLLEPEAGQARYSNHYSHRITGVHPRSDGLLITDSSGRVLTWEPETGATREIIEGGDRALSFLSVSSEEQWALAYDRGLLEIRKPDQQVRWRRNYHIDISVPPLWLEGSEKLQLLVANQARRVVAYGPRGEQLVSRLIKGRPKALIAWSSRLCLVVPSLVNELIWYNGGERHFVSQPMSHYQNLAVSNGSYVLLVDNDDIIRLYRRNAGF